MKEGGRFDLDGRFKRTGSVPTTAARRWAQMSDRPKTSGVPTQEKIPHEKGFNQH